MFKGIKHQGFFIEFLIFGKYNKILLILEEFIFSKENILMSAHSFCLWHCHN